MSLENQKWSENAPEVISEGLKFKVFLGGGMPPDPLPPQSALSCAVPSPPQILLKYYLAPPLSIFLNEALPWMCSVHNNSFMSTPWFTWTNHSCKQSVGWDANQSLRQGKQRIINIFRAKKPKSVALFILFMMVVEHWQLQEHMDWHKANNTL